MPEVKSESFAGSTRSRRLPIWTRLQGGGFEVLVVAAEKLETQQIVAGHEALNLVEDCKRIERAQLRLEVVGGEPDGVTVGLAGLRAAALAHVGAEAFAEGNERAHVRAHLVGDPHDHLEVACERRRGRRPC